MSGEDVSRKTFGSMHKTVGLLFLVFALVFLVAAAALGGVDRGQIGVRVILIILGACMTTAGATIYWLSKNEGCAGQK